MMRRVLPWLGMVALAFIILATATLSLTAGLIYSLLETVEVMK